MRWFDTDGVASVALAGRFTRLASRLVDVLLLGAAVMASFVCSMMLTETGSEVLVLFGLSPVVVLLLAQAYMLVRHGQTLAKRLFGIRVVRSNGDPVDPFRVLVVRELLFVLLGYIPFAGLIDAARIFGADQRCFHDLAADTIVVEVRRV